MVQRQASLADRVALFDGLHHVGLGKSCGFAERAAQSELGSQRRSERAARAMRVFGLHAIAAKHNHFVPVEEHVHGSLQMPALDDYSPGSHLHELPRCRFHFRRVLDACAGERLRFVNVRRNHARALH